MARLRAAPPASVRLALLCVALLAAPVAFGQAWEVRVSELRGTPVTTPAGAALGTIAGVLLDVRPRGVHYALLEVEGQPAKRFAYPLNALRPGPTPALLLDARPENLRIAPGYDERSWPDEAFRDDSRYVRGVKLLGTAARDALGNRVGRVADVVVSLRTGATQRLVVDFDDGASFALPAHAVQLRPGGGAVIVADSSRRG